MASKFIINKDIPNEYILTIKQNGSTLGMVIEPTDTFEFRLYERCTDILVAVLTMVNSTNGKISIADYNNGKVKIEIATVLANTLTKSTGDKVDGCYLKSEYRALLDCTTTNNGNFVAKIDSVYVE